MWEEGRDGSVASGVHRGRRSAVIALLLGTQEECFPASAAEGGAGFRVWPDVR